MVQHFRSRFYPEQGAKALRQSFVGRLLLLVCLTACATKDSAPGKSTIAAAKLIAGGWSPSSGVIGASNSNYKSGTTPTDPVSYTYTVSSASMVRFNDAWGGREVTVDLGSHNATEFGQNGSVTLVANGVGYPYNGGVYPVLTAFYVVPSVGSAIEYVNVTSNCGTSGMWTCISGSCSANAACTVQSGSSSFFGRTDWDQHQIPPFGYVTTNNFPRCDNSGGVGTWSGCPAGQESLPTGHYYAKYIMMSDAANASVLAGVSVGLSVRMIVKQDASARVLVGGGGTGGGINLNVVLVGDKNVNDSRTAKGALNLNLMFNEVGKILQSNANVGIGNIQVYDWTDANGGNQYSSVDLNNLGNLFIAGSKGVNASDEGKYINVFIVSDIQCSSCGGFIILGLSGAILGPPVNGASTSGLAFSTADQLAAFNPGYNATTCNRRGCLENDFLEMGSTIAHELGHYLGLNHPSERPNSNGYQGNDQTPDTPICSGRPYAPSTPTTLDQRACYFDTATTQPGIGSGGNCKTACNAAIGGANTYMDSGAHIGTVDPATGMIGDMPNFFCPAIQECQFNHTMWYTTKKRKLGGSWVNNDNAWQEDGNLFSSQSQAVLQWNSFVR